MIDGCDTGVADKVHNDQLISSLIDGCADDVKNHGQYVKCVTNLTNYLKKANVISGKEKGAIQSCGAQADIP